MPATGVRTASEPEMSRCVSELTGSLRGSTLRLHNTSDSTCINLGAPGLPVLTDQIKLSESIISERKK